MISWNYVQIKALKSHLKTDPSKKDEYRNLNSNIRKSMKKAKDDWIQDQCASINKDMNNNRSNKKAYNTLKLRNETKKRQ